MVEAVEYFSANHSEIGLVIFDLNLVECTGIEVYEALKKIDPEFTGIMASGQFIDEDAPKYTAIGFKEIILKPYNLNKLKELIEKYL
jgi:DNA-binding NtrC family response regulator